MKLLFKYLIVFIAITYFSNIIAHLLNITDNTIFVKMIDAMVIIVIAIIECRKS